MDNNWEAETERIWTEAEHKYRVVFGRAFRAHIEMDVWVNGADTGENEEYLKRKIDRYMKAIRLFRLSAKAKLPSEIDYRGPYQKCFERRLYMLSFIVKAKGGLEARADWPRIADAWNAANPSDVIGPITLKREYYAAKNDKHVMHSFEIELDSKYQP